MDEERYIQLADAAFHRIERAFENVDPDLAEADLAGDVLTVLFRDGSRCVVNTQRSTRQIWLAARSRGWHFDYDESRGAWIDDRGSGTDLFRCIEDVTRECVGVPVTI